MSAKHLIFGLTAASLLMPASVSVVKTQEAQHAGHANNAGNTSIRGPLPEAVREATKHFRNLSNALAAGYVQNGGCVSGPEEGAMGVHFANFALFDAILDVERPEVLGLRTSKRPTSSGRGRGRHARCGMGSVRTSQRHRSRLDTCCISRPDRIATARIPFYELHVWAWKQQPAWDIRRLESRPCRGPTGKAKRMSSGLLGSYDDFANSITRSAV